MCRTGICVLAFGVVATGLGTPGALAQNINLYGETGLIDLPTAQSQPDGELSFSYSRFGRTERSGVTFQLLPRVSGSVRVATVRDTPGGPDVSAQGFDLKFQLVEENGMLPGIALGFRDILGDGPYGAEYIVASKEVVDGLTVTGGLGWGRLGGQGGFANPLGRDTRPAPTDPAGRLQPDSYFAGDVAPFGGIAWETPVDGVTLMAEYSPDRYTAEQAGGFNRRSPLNFGISYAPNDHVQMSAAYLYGSTVGVQLSFSGNPFKPVAPQDLGVGPVPVRTRAADAPRSGAWADTAEVRDKVITSLAEVLAPEGILIDQARITGEQITLNVENTSTRRVPKVIGRISRVLSLAMPASVERFQITIVEDGLPITTALIDRSDLEAQVDRPDAGLSSWQSTQLMSARAQIEGPADEVWTRPPPPRFNWSFGPTIPVTLLDADEGFRPDLLLRGTASYQVARGLSLNAEVSRFILGRAQRSSTSTSTLPQVRSDSDVYYSGRDVDIDRLTMDYVFKPAPSVYGRLSGGILERMFTGVSSEVLYAPATSAVALGAELNYVQQRAFDDPFALKPYDVVTGHGSVYWDTGWHNVEAQLDVGRYLAGDWGATVTLGRRFDNGWDVRAFATQTDVGYDRFGQGSFTKGFSVSIPLRWTVPFETRSTLAVDLLPGDSDGGARLNVKGRLYERVRDLDEPSLEREWSTFWQ